MKIYMKKITIALLMTLIIGLLTSCSSVSSILTSDNKELTHALTAYSDDLERVIEAVEADADPNFIDNKGISILMYTVGANAESGITYENAEDNDSYKTLLNDKRTKINLKGKLGFTALDYACRDSGDLDKVNYLISHGATIGNGANVNGGKTQYSPPLTCSNV